MLKKGHSLRMKKDRSLLSISGHGSRLSRHSSMSSSGGSTSSNGGCREKKRSSRRPLASQQNRSVSLIAQGSFRVKHGESSVTLNVVKVNHQPTDLTCRTLLRATSKGACLMRGDSIRSKTRDVGMNSTENQ